MTRSELPNPHFGNERIIPNFRITTKVWEKEMPPGSVDKYSWVYVPDQELLWRDQEQIIAENNGVLETVLGEAAWDPILLPRVYDPTGIGDSDARGQRILLPLSIAGAIAEVDSGKVDQRDALSRNHGKLFLEATVGVLDDIVSIVGLSGDPDLLDYEMAQHFRFMMENAAEIGEQEKARDYISKITTSLSGQPLDQFSIALSGLRTTVLLNGKPFFTNYYGADDIVRKMIANDLLPAFVKGMDQKHVWFRSDAARSSAFGLPDFSEEDLLLQECRTFGYGSDTKKFIESYLSGDLGVGFINAISKEFIADLKERRLQGVFDNEEERKGLAERMKQALLGADTDLDANPAGLTPAIGQNDSLIDQYEDLEKDPDMIRRERLAKKRKPLMQRPFED